MMKALMVSSFLVVLATGVWGSPCPPFSCGELRNISYPFRLLGGPPECGLKAYELTCSGLKATIKINTGMYVVTKIERYSFRVIDANLDMNSSCPLPQWNQIPFPDYGTYRIESGVDDWLIDSEGSTDLISGGDYSACFVNCSRAITNSNSFYSPVTCLSAKNSFVYVSIGCCSCPVGALEPSCGYLAMIPLDLYDYEFYDREPYTGQNRSYGDIVKLIRKGFPVLFPTDVVPHTNSQILRTCLTYSISYFDDGVGISTFLWSVVGFAMCVHDYSEQTKLFWVVTAIISFIEVFKYIIALALLSRFFFVPLVVWTFLAHKFWKTKISIDAVEKFLRMRHDFGPTRFDYTDIIAITSHFRDKLGQGGYGSVFKGVLLPGRVHVAIKMLEGNSSCNGEDFISEVSTIGRIHHVNVVRLVGFCSEEMRRALVYEYMPGGSLDKYIFATEKSFPWDKLNEIALGIARGMNYLHQGCEMQILHFDIKPHNILLDSNFVPKVADFGLAKLYPRDNSFVPSNALRGTVGYIAPEMISRSFGAISSKSDVYSFGMLLLEMAGGRRNADPNAANSSQSYYPSWVYDKLTAQEVDAISPVAGMHELERKLCIVGLWCIQMKSHDRPTMSEVIDMLEGGFDGLQMPSRPFFCDDDHTAVPDSYPLLSELTEISEEDE
uniref:Iron-deficiency induced receptor-like kinase n=1 Tax=Hordeum vulgare TaxID=4513 RepID=W8VJT0_HORVU|nr:iron-deficiency induced receptor-like kinase [Hordeum vulgare subsp. vulgare]